MSLASVESATLTLATALVRINREMGEGVERLRADQLIRDAREAWPGETADHWSKWLLEASLSVGLRVRTTRRTLDDAISMARDGAVVVGYNAKEGGACVVLDGDARQVRLAAGEIDDSVSVPREEFDQSLEPAGEGDQHPWLVIDHPEISEAEHLAKKPVLRLLRLVRPEWNDIWVVLVFAFFAGVLSLAVPIAVESLVDTVAFGRVLQPVFVLAILLFVFLAFAAVMQSLQTYVTEIIQRRLFVRVAADLAYRLPRVDHAALGGAYGPEVVNRFLDVVTLQKVVASLLLDGVSIVLVTVVGMTVLAFYNPWLLGFDVLLLATMVSGLLALGRGAVSAGIDESKMKYRLVSWFEDLIRCEVGFKTQGGSDFAIDRANLLTAEYLTKRRIHFRVLFRQINFTLVLQAIAATVLLGAGGWLVIQKELTLGQLVAAELIVTMILASMAKLGKHLEGYYDAVAAVDKLGALFDLQLERHDGLVSGSDGRGVKVDLHGVRRAQSGATLVEAITALLQAGERVAVFGGAATGKTTLLRIIGGLELPSDGRLEIDGVDPRDLRPDILRRRVAFVGEPELFEGTIEENVHVRRPSVRASDVRSALHAVGVLGDLLRLPQGLQTKINASGAPLTQTQQRLLMFARAISGEPRLLLVDSALDALPDDDMQRVREALLDEQRGWTVIVSTGRRSVCSPLERVVRLGGGDNSHPVEALTGGATPS